MTDIKTNGARDAKGNLIPKEVWVTYHDLEGYDYPFLVSASAKPWDAAYDAPITKWASNVRYAPADLLADMTRQRDEAILMCELAQDKQNELLDTIERTRRQRDEARKQALEEAAQIAESANTPIFDDRWGVGEIAIAISTMGKIAKAIRALAEGAKP